MCINISEYTGYVLMRKTNYLQNGHHQLVTLACTHENMWDKKLCDTVTNCSTS